MASDQVVICQLKLTRSKKVYSFENVQWHPTDTVTNGSKKFGRINRVPILSRQALKLGQ